MVLPVLRVRKHNNIDPHKAPVNTRQHRPTVLHVQTHKCRRLHLGLTPKRAGRHDPHSIKAQTNSGAPPCANEGAMRDMASRSKHEFEPA